jgi:hypothetical protein
VTTQRTLSIALGAGALAAIVIVSVRGPVLSDEVFSLEMAARSWGGMASALRGDVHPPLYYFLLKLWFLAGLGGVAGLRLFSLVWALASLCLLARGRWLSQTGGSGGVWLLASNPLVLLMAGYGRMYTLLLFLCLLTLELAGRILDGSGHRAARAGLAAAVCAGLLTHHWYLFFLAGLAVFTAAKGFAAGRRLAGPVAAGGLLYGLAWGRAAADQVAARAQHLAWLHRPGAPEFAGAVAAHVWTLAAGLLAVLLAAAFERARPQAGWRAGAALPAAAAALAVFTVPFLLSQWKPIFNPRFTVVAAPFLALALATVCGRWARICGQGALLAGCVWVLATGLPLPACSSLTAARFLAAESRPGDTVVFCRLSRKPVTWYWSGRDVRLQSFPASIDRHPGYEGPSTQPELAAEARRLALSAPGRIFVLADTNSTPSRILLDTLSRSGRLDRRDHLTAAAAGKHYFNLLAEFAAPAVRPEESPAGAPHE